MTDPLDLLTSSYDYHLPEELIAERPTAERDSARLMVIDRSTGRLREHTIFRHITQQLRSGDVLVLNNTRVIAARLYGERQPGGGVCEVLLLRPLAMMPGDGEHVYRWEAMTRPAKKLPAGSVIRFGEAGHEAHVLEEHPEGIRTLEFRLSVPMDAFLEELGNMPLPPYILARRGEKLSRPEDKTDYQTVYARTPGSVAAPTAGLHFTPALLEECRRMGVEILELTLNVGAGTFKPLNTEKITDYAIHTETYCVSEYTADRVTKAKAEGRRVIAVGTTSVRTLESAAEGRQLMPGENSTELLISPGYEWKLVDGLITNFHLPCSSLLCLVAALTGRKNLLDLYATAVQERYRFYSYGDAMMIH
jgi:S-adenosylmethionine:tRNA ribosyltransferase-isomerase